MGGNAGVVCGVLTHDRAGLRRAGVLDRHACGDRQCGLAFAGAAVEGMTVQVKRHVGRADGDIFLRVGQQLDRRLSVCRIDCRLKRLILYAVYLGNGGVHLDAVSAVAVVLRHKADRAVLGQNCAGERTAGDLDGLILEARVAGLHRIQSTETDQAGVAAVALDDDRAFGLGGRIIHCVVRRDNRKAACRRTVVVLSVARFRSRSCDSAAVQRKVGILDLNAVGAGNRAVREARLLVSAGAVLVRRVCLCGGRAGNVDTAAVIASASDSATAYCQLQAVVAAVVVENITIAGKLTVADRYRCVIGKVANSITGLYFRVFDFICFAAG